MGDKRRIKEFSNAIRIVRARIRKYPKHLYVNNSYHHSPLHFAAEKGDVEAIKTLVNLGANRYLINK